METKESQTDEKISEEGRAMVGLEQSPEVGEYVGVSIYCRLRGGRLCYQWIHEELTSVSGSWPP